MADEDDTGVEQPLSRRVVQALLLRWPDLMRPAARLGMLGVPFRYDLVGETVDAGKQQALREAQARPDGEREAAVRRAKRALMQEGPGPWRPITLMMAAPIPAGRIIRRGILTTE